MSNNDIQELFKPSLTKNTKASGLPYPNVAHIIVAWFGGPIASTIFCLLSLNKLGILREKYKLSILVSALSFFGFLIYAAIKTELIKLSSLGFPIEFIERINAMGYSVLGVLTYGSFFFFFRSHFKAARLFDSGSASPWLAGIFCIFLGAGILLNI